MTGAWIGIGSVVLIDAVVITLIALNVIKIKEKAKKEHGSEDEF